MPQGKLFRIGYGIIMIFIIIYLATLVDFIFKPIVVLVQTLFAPIILAGVLYYLFRPFVKLLNQRLPRGISILILYLSAVAVFTTLIIFLGPEIQRQFNNLVENMPYFISEIRLWAFQLQQYEFIANFQDSDMFSIEELTTKFASYINEFVSAIGTNLAALISVLTNIVIVMILIPFILFYMLYEGEKAPNQVLRLLPTKHQDDGQRVLGDMDRALSSYIQGQIIVSAFVGVMCYVGYLIIGIEYPLILALIAMFTNVIPFVGPWIGMVPAVIVGFFFHSPFMALLVIIVVVVVQQIESNIVAPRVHGKKLSIHPLTIILLILVAGNFAGLLGLILAVPTYAVGKVIVSHTYRLWKLRKLPID